MHIAKCVRNDYARQLHMGGGSKDVFTTRGATLQCKCNTSALCTVAICSRYSAIAWPFGCGSCNRLF
eukprot:1745773-Amphidinium_carterae.1